MGCGESLSAGERQEIGNVQGTPALVTVGENLLLAPPVDFFLDTLPIRVLVFELRDGPLALRTAILFVADPL